MGLKEIEQDLFDAEPEYAFAHCVSRDAEMGEGIAVDFDFLFTGMKEFIIDTNPQIGQAIAYKHHDGRIVFNLVTKRRSFHKPTYETLESSLMDMKSQMVALEITSIAMPKIGSGLDKLVWVRVKQIIESVFADDIINILICHHKPRKRGIMEKMFAKSAYAKH